MTYEIKHMVTAQPNYYLLWYRPPGDGKPAGYSRDPIIAWGFTDNPLGVEPVTIEQIGYPSATYSMAVQFPDGTVCEANIASYESAADWVQAKTEEMAVRGLVES